MQYSEGKCMSYHDTFQSLLATVHPSWVPWMTQEFEKPYMQALQLFLEQESNQHKNIFPKPENILKAFSLTSYGRVKVVILGQDPYHQMGQAHGLCFSVPPGIALPPSLNNIYKELVRDLKVPRPKTGSLEHWARQGVLLLNSVLTVEEGFAASHQKRGWETFTDHIIQRLSVQREHLVFVLWGSYAQQKGQWIDEKRHLVLKSVHPSPLSVHRGFEGCGHFSKINQYLQKIGKAPIAWV
jgi:uracil-DNA glycosylase